MSTLPKQYLCLINQFAGTETESETDGERQSRVERRNGRLRKAKKPKSADGETLRRARRQQKCRTEGGEARGQGQSRDRGMAVGF